MRCHRIRFHSLLLFATGALSILSGCRPDGGKAKPGYCVPQVTEGHDKPAAVTQVDIYWDTSASMQKTYLKKKGAPNALTLLWQNLARTWVRDGAVAEVNQYSMGRNVAPLVQLGVVPRMTSDYTNIPEAAMKAGEFLAGNPHAAVILVSDMQVDRPPETAGEVVCGQVKAAAGPGRVPAHFGQCLVESWTNVPAWTTLTGLIVHAAEPKLRAPLPLFVMVLSRNPDYAASLNQRLKDRLSEGSAGPLVAASLVLAAQQPSVPCDRLSKCAYRVRSDTVALHKDEKGSQPCSFRATATRGTHALRCAVQPVDSVQDGVIRVRRVKAESLDLKRLRAEQPKAGYVDLNCQMDSWSAGLVKAGLRFAYEWTVADDVDNQISEWLGETWAANDDYRSTFRTAVSAMHAKFPPVRCAEEWFIPYTK